MMEQALENPLSVVAAEQQFACVFRMRHQAGHVAALVANAGDVQQGTVGIRPVGEVPARVAVLPENLMIGLKLGEGRLIRKVAALAVRNGDSKNFSGWSLVREWRVQRGGLEENVFAMEEQVSIPDKGAWQESGFGEDLKSVADAEDKPAVVSELLHRLHDRTEPRDGTTAQIIAVAESARHDDSVGLAE